MNFLGSKRIHIGLLFVLLAADVHGQSPFTILTNLSSPSVADPCGVILVGNTLFGLTEFGGSSTTEGNVFSLGTDGGDLAYIHSFTGQADGERPTSGLALAGGVLYGTSGPASAAYGGTVLFSVTTNGAFSAMGNLLGGPATGPLAFAGETFFVTSEHQLYSQNIVGTDFNLLHTFSNTSTNPPYTNADGTWPIGGVVLSGNMLYGTASQGGAYGQGVIFGMNTNGDGFTNLYNFTGEGDGGFPTAPLISSGNTLYGYTYLNTNGAVFSVKTDGTDFSILHEFGSGIGLGVSELSSPPLILAGNTLYGALGATLFSLETNGNDFTTLAALQLSGPAAISSNILYGTAYQGGAEAIVFALQLPTSPIITRPPTNTATVVGNTASFTVVASGSQPLNYQWALNGTNIPGATSATYAISNAFPSNSGFYTAIVSNAFGFTNSMPARLTVIPISILSPTILADGSFQFSIPVTANVNYEVQYSNDLTNWMPLVTFSQPVGLLTVTAPGTASNQQFYRVSVSPITP